MEGVQEGFDHLSVDDRQLHGGDGLRLAVREAAPVQVQGVCFPGGEPVIVCQGCGEGQIVVKDGSQRKGQPVAWSRRTPKL